jgi:hypothetical protein
MILTPKSSVLWSGWQGKTRSSERARAEAKAGSFDVENSRRLTFDVAIGRYWEEHGKCQKNAKTLWGDFKRVTRR